MVEAGVGMKSGSSASVSSKGRAMLLRPDKNEDGVRTCSDEMSSPMYVRGRVFSISSTPARNVTNSSKFSNLRPRPFLSARFTSPTRRS